jgi:hypothetical protein
LSFNSVKSAVTPLIIAGVTAGGSVTVQDRNTTDQLIPPLTMLPLVRLRQRASTEVPFAVGFADRPWYLECTLWAAFAIDTDQGPFDTMVEQLATVLRNHTLIGGTAGDPVVGSQVYVSGRSLQFHPFPALPGGGGMMLRHEIVSCLVRESITIAAMV